MSDKWTWLPSSSKHVGECWEVLLVRNSTSCQRIPPLAVPFSIPLTGEFSETKFVFEECWCSGLLSAPCEEVLVRMLEKVKTGSGDYRVLQSQFIPASTMWFLLSMDLCSPRDEPLNSKPGGSQYVLSGLPHGCYEATNKSLDILQSQFPRLENMHSECIHFTGLLSGWS